VISRDIIRSNSSAKRLGDVAEFLDARRRPVKEEERKPGPFPYYGANGQQGTIDGYLFDEPLVLLAEDGGHFDQPQRGVAYRVSGKTWVNNHAHVLRPKQCIDIGFLCRVLENYDLSPFITGTTRGKLTKAGAEEIPVPLPSLDQQRRIAAILDQADNLCHKRREAIERLEQITSAIFTHMFVKASASREFAVMPLGELCALIRDGTHKTPTYVERGIPFVTVRNIVNGTLDLSNTKFISEQEHLYLTRRVAPTRGDILVAKDGTIGVPCAVVTDDVFSIFVSVALLRPKPDLIDQAFLTAQLRTASVQKQIKERS
jgi:restriction endonuclease S subunit